MIGHCVTMPGDCLCYSRVRPLQGVSRAVRIDIDIVFCRTYDECIMIFSVLASCAALIPATLMLSTIGDTRAV